MHTGGLRVLRKLQIDRKFGSPSKNLIGWELSALEWLAWDSTGGPLLVWGNASIARFLERCHFPSLHTADLRIYVSENGGPEQICHFMRVHQRIRDLTLRVYPTGYPLIIPAVRASRFNLQFSDRLEHTLIDYLSPEIQKLSLPVFLSESRDGVAPITETLQALAERPGSVCEVHLKLRELGSGRTCIYEPLPRHGFRFDCTSLPPRALKVMNEIRGEARRLCQRGITVYDEEGYAYKDDPASEAEHWNPRGRSCSKCLRLQTQRTKTLEEQVDSPPEDDSP
jgi:hypothetical protein